MTANINGISGSTGWKLHFDPINNNPETFNAIESHLRNTARIQFKGGGDLGNNHGEGKSYTAYPQSLEERDRVIAALHHKDTGVSHLLAPANPVEGNMQFTDNITGRFTTGYNFISSSTGEIDWSRSAASPQEGLHSVARLRETGEVNRYIKDSWNTPWSSKPPGMEAMRTSQDEIVEDIASLKTNHPAVHELMVGKPGYNSPYPVHLPGVSNSSPSKVNLLEVGRTLDPRFGEGMPQEVADAFANDDIQRLFRTSKHAPQRTPNQIIPQKADKYGDYQGSIYVQHKDGRVARFKNPEVALDQGDMRHAGWQAKTAGVEGRSPFFDQAHVIDIDSYRDDPVNSAVAQAVEVSKRANPGATNLQNTDHLANLARHNMSSVATPTTSQASSVLGGTIFETNKPGSTAIDAGSTHMGDRVTDIYESTGERFFFQGDTTQNVLGDVSPEPISSFLERRSRPISSAASGTTAAATAAPTPKKDMLALAKQLRPDVEEGMPEEVSAAFKEGRVKKIFRTDTSGFTNKKLRGGAGNTDAGGHSIYVVDDKGRIARMGKYGAGWNDPRVTGTTAKSKSPWLEGGFGSTPDGGASNEEMLVNRDKIATGEVRPGESMVEYDTPRWQSWGITESTLVHVLQMSTMILDKE